jgi:hypothetical protein
LSLVNVNEAVTPRAKSRVVVDIDTGRILRTVVVVVVVAGWFVVGIGIGITAVAVVVGDAGVEGAAIDVGETVVLLRGGEITAVVDIGSEFSTIDVVEVGKS